MLAVLLEFEGAMRASLMAQYPALPPLRQILSGTTDVTPSELADYVKALPPGCALWREVGGDIAWSVEAHLLARIEHVASVHAWLDSKDGQSGNNRPKPITPPESVFEKRAQEARIVAKADAWKRRTGQD